jgi:hypothetical protein
MLAELVSRLQRSLSIQHKQDICKDRENMGSQWTKEQIRLRTIARLFPMVTKAITLLLKV